LAHHKKGLKLSRLLNVEVFTPNKVTYKPQYWPSYVGSKRLMLGKSYMGQSEVLLGTYYRMHLELEKDVGNPLGT
jgi:hypothetical protein